MLFRDSPTEGWKPAVFSHVSMKKEKIEFYLFIGEEYSECINAYGAFIPLDENIEMIGKCEDVADAWDQDAYADWLFGKADQEEFEDWVNEKVSINRKIENGLI